MSIIFDYLELYMNYIFALVKVVVILLLVYTSRVYSKMPECIHPLRQFLIGFKEGYSDAGKAIKDSNSRLNN